MSRVLIVEDEQDYREELALALSRDGHETRETVNGREAIDVGSRYRPDVLVADWMLKDQVHGLHVSQVLRLVCPDLQTILITGFPSPDLRQEAADLQVFEFIEKPFGLKTIQEAVRGACHSPATPNRVPIAILELDQAGSIRQANARARQLLAETRGDPEPTLFADHFTPETTPDLQAAAERWVVARPRTPDPVNWHIRSQRPRADGSRLVVMLTPDEPHHTKRHLLDMLLEVKEPVPVRWPFEGRVVVLDGEEVFRRWAASGLGATGATCYRAETCAEAIKLIQNDAGILFVIVEDDLPGEDIPGFIEQARTSQPRITIVGNSEQDRREAFRALGVEHFLIKPWQTQHLINLLLGRIGNCASCGLPLPLNRPPPGGTAQSWICSGCGARYVGLLDRNAPSDLQGNVRPATS